MTPASILGFARFYYYRHGWPAAIGVVLLIFALGMQAIGVPKLQAQATDARAAHEALRKRALQAPKPQDASREQYAALLASLPSGANASSDAVKAIHRIAATHGVYLATGEYRVVREGSDKLQRYQITLPATSNYPKLRAWLTDVMNEMPTIALDEISLRREDVGTEQIDARVRFTLFLKSP